MNNLTISLLATFTIDPLRELLAKQFRMLGVDVNVILGSYGQVAQQLLDSTSSARRNTCGVTVVLVRASDLLTGPADNQEAAIQNADMLLRALLEGIHASSSPFVMFVTPSTEEWSHALPIESYLDEQLTIHKVLHIMPERLVGKDAPSAILDHYREKQAHIPYTDYMFSVVATAIVRCTVFLFTPPRKALILDCDNVLWRGVCGECGINNLEIGHVGTAIQKFALQQRECGLSLCLCSRNSEEDIQSVFHSHPGMLLHWEDISAVRANWKPKYQNVIEIATELGFGLDSLIFFDDDPVECHAMRQYCPEVLTIQIPDNIENLAALLNNTWAFDHFLITDEDAARSRYRGDDAKRSEARAVSLSLEDFIEHLEVRTTISPVVEADLDRASQITYRTTQFNTSGLRMTRAAINSYLNPPRQGCFVIRVADRYGDYGLVGLVLYRLDASVLIIDAFQLSCRALGREVETTVHQHLLSFATQLGAEKLEYTFVPTSRNAPARLFLERLSAQSIALSGGAHRYRVCLEMLQT